MPFWDSALVETHLNSEQACHARAKCRQIDTGQIETRQARPSQVISGQIKRVGSRSSYCLRHRRSRAVDVRNGGRCMRGLRGRAGEGTGHLVETTWAKYPGMQVLGSSIFSPWVRTPVQGYLGKLGPPLGLGSEQPGKAHGPLPPFCSVPCPVLSCPALPR